MMMKNKTTYSFTVGELIEICTVWGRTRLY